MSNWMWITTWVLGTLLTSRWTIGVFVREEMCDGSIDDPDEWMLAALVMIATILGWPMVLVGVVIYRTGQFIGRTPIGPAVANSLRWFYTVDRDKRKKIFQ